MPGIDQEFKRLEVGDRVSAKAWNEMADALSRLSKFTGGGSVMINGSGLFRRQVIENPVLLGKTDAAIDKGDSGTVSLYSGSTKGSETDTGENVEAYNRFADLDSGVWVHVTFVGTDYELSAAEC